MIPSKFAAAATAISAALALVQVGPAHAATIMDTDGTPLAESVHTNGNQTGTTVTTKSNPSGYFVDFTSVDPLSISGNGMAKVDGPFGSITMSPEGPPSANQGLVGFSEIKFTVTSGVDGSTAGDTFTVVANFLGGGSDTFSNIALDTNDKYLVTAGSGEVITSLSIENLANSTGAPIQFGDVRQVYFNGIGGTAPGVPEPATWALMLVGFGGLGAVMRSRRRTAAVSV